MCAYVFNKYILKIQNYIWIIYQHIKMVNFKKLNFELRFNRID